MRNVVATAAVWMALFPCVGRAQFFPPFETAASKTAAGLWDRPNVQKELKLEPKQIEAIGNAIVPLSERFRKEVLGLRSASNPQEARKKYDAFREAILREAADAVEKVLDDKQTKRLREIVLQVREGEALRDPDLQKTLKFSEGQAKQVEAVYAELQRKLDDLARDAKDVRPKNAPDLTGVNPLTLHREFNVRVRAVLNAEQQARFRELLGEPFPPRPKQ